MRLKFCNKIISNICNRTTQLTHRYSTHSNVKIAKCYFVRNLSNTTMAEISDIWVTYSKIMTRFVWCMFPADFPLLARHPSGVVLECIILLGELFHTKTFQQHDTFSLSKLLAIRSIVVAHDLLCFIYLLHLVFKCKPKQV